MTSGLGETASKAGSQIIQWGWWPHVFLSEPYHCERRSGTTQQYVQDGSRDTSWTGRNRWTVWWWDMAWWYGSEDFLL